MPRYRTPPGEKRTDAAAKNIRIAMIVTPIGRLNESELYVSYSSRVKSVPTEKQSFVYPKSLHEKAVYWYATEPVSAPATYKRYAFLSPRTSA
jgi:hypothetical protein